MPVVMMVRVMFVMLARRTVVRRFRGYGSVGRLPVAAVFVVHKHSSFSLLYFIIKYALNQTINKK